MFFSSTKGEYSPISPLSVKVLLLERGVRIGGFVKLANQLTCPPEELVYELEKVKSVSWDILIQCSKTFYKNDIDYLAHAASMDNLEVTVIRMEQLRSELGLSAIKKEVHQESFSPTGIGVRLKLLRKNEIEEVSKALKWPMRKLQDFESESKAPDISEVHFLAWYYETTIKYIIFGDNEDADAVGRKPVLEMSHT